MTTTGHQTTFELEKLYNQTYLLERALEDWEHETDCERVILDLHRSMIRAGQTACQIRFITGSYWAYRILLPWKAGWTFDDN